VDSRRRQGDSKQEAIICTEKPHQIEEQKFQKVIYLFKHSKTRVSLFTKIRPIRLHDLEHVIKINQWEIEKFNYFYLSLKSATRGKISKLFVYKDSTNQIAWFGTRDQN